jgi:hypothetical protein
MAWERDCALSDRSLGCDVGMWYAWREMDTRLGNYGVLERTMFDMVQGVTGLISLGAMTAMLFLLRAQFRVVVYSTFAASQSASLCVSGPQVQISGDACNIRVGICVVAIPRY